MTALAMGAATRPPVASSPRLPPSSTTAATAIDRSPDEVKPMNQACGSSPRACWAVPVLPATWRPGIWAAVPVPLSTTWSIMSLRSPATCSGITWPKSSPSNRLTTLPLSETTSWATNGPIANGGHLQRGDAHVALADGALCGGGHVLPLGDDAGGGGQLVGAGLVEAELLGLVGQLLAAQLDPEAGEGGVAGDLQRLGQGQGAAAAARAAEVADVGRGLGHVEDVRGRQLVAHGDAVLQRRRGRDHLEGRPGRVQRPGGPVQQRAVLVVDQALPVAPDLLGAVAGQLVGVVAGEGGHGQDRPGPRVERHHRPLAVPEGGLGRLLGGPVKGQDQRPAGGLAGGEQVGHVLAELLGGPPEQERVELLLGQGAAEDQRVEAGDHAVALALGVLADELQRVAP